MSLVMLYVPQTANVLSGCRPGEKFFTPHILEIEIDGLYEAAAAKPRIQWPANVQVVGPNGVGYTRNCSRAPGPLFTISAADMADAMTRFELTSPVHLAILGFLRNLPWHYPVVPIWRP